MRLLEGIKIHSGCILGALRRLFVDWKTFQSCLHNKTIIEVLENFLIFVFKVRESFFEEVISKLDYSSVSNISLGNFGGTHQQCKDMFIYSKWNGSKTYEFKVERDFGTDYGICCWYTPQFNFSEILKISQSQGLKEPNWGFWFTRIKKVTLS